MKRKEPKTIFTSAIAYGDAKAKWLMVLLCIVSAICATCNVLLPLFEKWLLDDLNSTTGMNRNYAPFIIVGVVGAVALAIETFVNISVMMRIRRQLEQAILHALAYKEQQMISEKGVGVYASMAIGDSEQLAKVMAAGWFSILFNLIGAIASIIISARWNQYFLIIVSIAYVLILIVIFVFNYLSVRNFRKEKLVSYSLASHIRESVESHRSIIGFGSFSAYQDGMREEYRLRHKYMVRSEDFLGMANSLIKLIETLALVFFFLFAFIELRDNPDDRHALYPVFIALVSYFTTIFLPVTTINSTFNNASKFRAFYDDFLDTVEFSGIGKLPEDLSFKVEDVSLLENYVLQLSDVTIDFDKTYAVLGLDGEARANFISYVRGEKAPQEGRVIFGGCDLSEVYKNLRLSLLAQNPSHVEVFETGLEFNLTLGKELLNDEEYEQKKEEYLEHLKDFFDFIDDGNKFRHGKAKLLYHSLAKDFFALEKRLRDDKNIRAEIIDSFRNVADREKFIATIGPAMFAKKYAKKSRYNRVVDKFDLHSLYDRDFGVGGKKLLESERSIILLSRFLIPEVETPFILVNPLEHLSIALYPKALAMLKEELKGRNGLLMSTDFEDLEAVANEVIVFSHGNIVEHGKPANLLRRKSRYAEMKKEVESSSRRKKS